ncbi:MAG: nuclear transport factor 2 family protein [Burkholderiales bacterium]
MYSIRVAFAALASLLAACVATAPRLPATEARQQVFSAERAFAKTMADRDHRAFTSFIADDSVFFSGPKPIRGKQQIADAWARFYAAPTAPFSWEPEEVEVLESGTLALSSGPVRDAQGKVFARFNSIWKRDASGVWRVVFDKGSDVCDCPSK